MAVPWVSRTSEGRSAASRPARLSILSLLAPADWVLFSFLRDTIGTSDSALSKQLSALEDAGYVELHKDRAARRRGGESRTAEAEGEDLLGLHGVSVTAVRATGLPRYG